MKKESEFLQGVEALSIGLFKLLGEVLKLEEKLNRKEVKQRLTNMVKNRQGDVEREIKRVFDVG